MALKQPALIIERDRRKKKKQSEATPMIKKPTKEVVKNNKGTTYINRDKISTKPSAQNSSRDTYQKTYQNRVVTNKERLTSKPTISTANKDITTIKGRNSSRKKYSTKIVDIYERDGQYYYKDGKKEKTIDTKFVQNALKNNKKGVIGAYDSKGRLRETDENGNIKAYEKNVLKKAGRVIKGTALGIGKGFTSIADAGMQETRNDLQKGEKIDNYKDLAKNEIKALIHAMSPALGRNAANKEASKNIRKIWKDKDKTLWQKIVGTGLEATNTATFGDIQGLKESVRGIGAVDHSADEKVKKVQDKIDKPINEKLEELEMEGYRYDPITNTITNWNRNVGQMGAGIAVGAATKNPELAIATMGLSAKGQATERAEAAGADLDTATKMGTAAGWIEAATEKITGGAKIFGGGALDDIVEGTINSKIKNKGINFIAKQGYGLLGETMEETLSDLAGVMIDRGTINPKAKYTLDDFLETAKDTFGSTFILNLLTGGYGGRAYRGNVANMQNYQNQMNEIVQQVESGMIDTPLANEYIKQVKNGTYQQNRNLDQIAAQQRDAIDQAVQTGQLSQADATQEIKALDNTLASERERINNSQQLQDKNIKNNVEENKNTVQQNYEGLNQKEYNEIQRRYKNLIETTGFEEDFIENAKPSDIVNQLKSIKKLYEGDEGFLYEAKNWESPEVYKNTKSQYDKINRLINRFEGKINQQRNVETNQVANNKEISYNDNTNVKGDVENEFRKLQEESRGISNEEQQLYRRGSKEIDENLRGRLSRILGQRVESSRSSNSNDARVLKDNKSGNEFEVYDDVDGQTFRDLFEIARTYTRNGELVDLHPVESGEYETGYNDTKNYVSKDGLSGFSITKDGDLISVFNANNKRGWLRAIAPEIKAKAKTLDCYMSENQPLHEMYEKIFGFKVASIMDYNMEYDHDDIAKNHNMPQVAFMVKTDQDIETKHFNKDQYDEALEYRNSLVDNNESSNIPATKSENVNSEPTNKPTNSIKDIRKEVEEKTNKTMSKHIETSSKATGTVEDIRNMDYDTIVYDAMTNKKSKEQALRELEGKDIDTNVNDIHAKFRGTERLTHVDSAKITELMKQTKSLADEAKNNGNDSEYNKRMEQFRTLKGDYAVALSESGQFVQYAKVIKELDPDTQIDVLKKVIEREKRRGSKKYEDVTINEKLVEKYKKAQTDEERDTIMEEIKDDTARQIKITFMDKLNEFRFLSMLGNIKTHGRNIFGNVGMYSLQSFKDGVAAIGEDVYNMAFENELETRTKTLKPATKEVSKFVSDKVDVFLKDQKSKYNESRGMKGDLEGRRNIFSDNNIIGKALNKASNLNSKALDFEDRYFSSKMTKQAMKGFLTANGIETNADIEAHPELVAQALDYALFKGKEATFHQDSTTATAIRNLRDKLYTGSGFSKLGGLAVDTTLPFISTPANIGKNALEYTPIIGFGDINKQFQQAPDNMKANVVIDTLSKQFTGGALMAVGAFLAAKGLIKGSGDDDKEDKTEASLGNASYSVKIGKSTYDLSWLSPTAIPFFEGVEVFNAFKKAKSKGGIKATDTADLIDTMFGTLNPMTDMSVLQSVERVITSIAYGGNAVKSATSTTFSSYLQQYIPTLFSQFAQIGDSKQRNTNTGGNVLSKTFDQIKYKIPGARNTLPEKVDVWGNTNKTANNLPQRAFEALLSPANRKDYKVDKTTKELERLARETDDTAMLPTVKNKSLRVNKKDYELRGKDFVDLQKTYGKTAKKNLDKLIESDSYKNASDTKKQKMVRKIYDYASYKAKENYAKNKDINFDSGDQTSYAMIDAFKIPYEKYVESKVSGNDSATKMISKLNKAGFTKTQKAAIMNYFDRAYYVNEDKLYSTLENSNLSDKQKELVRKKYEKSITDSERERYKRADKIGVDYDLYANFRTYVTSDKARGESRTGGKTKRQKVIDYIQSLPLSAKQKYALYDDWNKNQRVFQYYK